MALVLSLKNTTFTEYVSVLTPPVGAYSLYNFGVDFSNSTTDKTGNDNNLSSLGSTAGLSYTDETVTFPQTATNQNAFALNNFLSKEFTVGWSITAGLYERLMTMPDASSFLVDSNGRLFLSLVNVAGTSTLGADQPVLRPFAVVITVNNSVTGTINVSFSYKAEGGSVVTKSLVINSDLKETFVGQQMRIGSHSSGSMTAKKMVTYQRALGQNEVGSLLDYLLQ